MNNNCYCQFSETGSRRFKGSMKEENVKSWRGGENDKYMKKRKERVPPVEKSLPDMYIEM